MADYNSHSKRYPSKRGKHRSADDVASRVRLAERHAQCEFFGQESFFLAAPAIESGPEELESEWFKESTFGNAKIEYHFAFIRREFQLRLDGFDAAAKLAHDISSGADKSMFSTQFMPLTEKAYPLSATYEEQFAFWKEHCEVI